MEIGRRKFMALSMAGAAGMAATSTLGVQNQATAQTHVPPDRLAALPTIRKGGMLYRQLGKTGESVSIIGLGGFHLGFMPDENESIAVARRAIDNGITFMDNCWDYNKGASEVRMGKALGEGYREKVFLMTKIDGRDKKTAARQIEESLHRLRTDRIDLMQFHEVIRIEDPDRIFASGGALDAVREAKAAGKIRYIGFTGHKDPLVHLRMLDVAAQHGFRFDTVQMPLNVMDAHFRSFQHQVLPVLVRDEIGVLGMKSMGDGFILKSKAVTPVECLHFAMNLPTSTVITGIDSQTVLDQALEAARTFSPMDVAQVDAMLSRTRQAAKTGEYELFKTSSHFDGTARNPKWLGAAE